MKIKKELQLSILCIIVGIVFLLLKIYLVAITLFIVSTTINILSYNKFFEATSPNKNFRK